MNNTTYPKTEKRSKTILPWQRMCILFLLGMLGCLLLSSDAFAYQIKRVVRGATTLDSNTESLTLNILASHLGNVEMDPNKAIIIVTRQTNSDDRRVSDILATIDDGQNITLNRRTSGVALVVNWMVVEFFSGVTVTSGITIVPDGTAFKNITIPSVGSLDKAFVLLTTRTNVSAAGADEAFIFAGRLTSATQLRIERGQASQGGTANEDVGYQIVVFDADDSDVYVQHGVVDIDNSKDAGEASDNGTTMVATIPTAVTMDKAFLVFSILPNDAVAGYEDRYAVNGRITATNQITFARVTNSSSVAVWWQVIEIKNGLYGIFTDRGYVSSTSNNNISITTAQGFDNPVAEKRSMAFMSVSGGQSSSTNRLDTISYIGQLNATGSAPAIKSTTYTVDRDSTSGVAGYISVEVVEFPPLRLTGPAAGEPWNIGSDVTISWDYSDELKANGNALTTCIELR